MRTAHASMTRWARHATSALRLCLAWSLGLLSAAGLAAIPSPVLHVIYPQINERPPSDYGFQILKLALEKSGKPFQLTLSRDRMNQERARAELAAGTISVVDFGTSIDFESRFDAVYFPIDRGLSGYRLCIINRDKAAAFAGVRSLGDFRAFVTGQGIGWSDARILVHNGIEVVSAEFESLFRMADAGRFDCFPLGVEEVHGFLDKYRALAPNSIVEDALVLRYRFARLYFVRKGNTSLQEALTKGLAEAFADGSFQRTLDANMQFRDALQKSHLQSRTTIPLDNPDLSERFRQIPEKYFYPLGTPSR